MLDARAEAIADAAGSGVIDLRPYQDQLVRLIQPELSSFFDLGVSLAGEEAPDLFAALDLKPEAAIEFAESYTYDLVTQITDTEANILAEKVSRGLDEGQSIPEIQASLEADPAFAGRGEVIARTEVQRATQTAKLDTYKRMGIRLRRSVTAPGATAAHQAIAAKSAAGIPVDEPIVRAGETYGVGEDTETFTRDIYAPPYRPNCRCSIEAIFDDDEGSGS